MPDFKKVTCKYCGYKNLYWIDAPEGWRLYTKKGNLHMCNSYFRHVVGQNGKMKVALRKIAPDVLELIERKS